MHEQDQASLRVKDVRKIAILRANELGDLLVTLPAISSIKQAYPQANITLLGKPWHKEFLAANRTAIDQVVVVPVMKDIRNEAHMADASPQEVAAFFNEMQAEKFDIALHFQGQGIAANPFINRLGARLTAGFTCSRAEKIDRSAVFYYYQNEVVRYLEVAELIGAQVLSLEPEVRILQQDTAEAMDYLHKHAIGDYVVVHPFGTDSRRYWADEKFAQVADRVTEMGYAILFTGSGADRSRIGNILVHMKQSAFNAGGAISLGGLAALLNKSKLVIATDTGPLHLAHAVGAKTTGIYWAPNLINWAPLTRKRHRPLICWDLHCSQCGTIPNSPYPFEPVTATCKHEHSFIRNITTEEVMNEVSTLLND